MKTDHALIFLQEELLPWLKILTDDARRNREVIRLGDWLNITRKINTGICEILRKKEKDKELK